MITITTATGKELNSDYATSLANPKVAFLRIVGETLETVRSIFYDAAELPVDKFPSFHTVAAITDENTGIKIILKP